jgi:hypothetical protein
MRVLTPISLYTTVFGSLMTMCASLGGLTVDPRSGTTGKLVSQVGDADEVWYDPGANNYYFAHGTQGEGAGATGVVNLTTEELLPAFQWRVPEFTPSLGTPKTATSSSP